MNNDTKEKLFLQHFVMLVKEKIDQLPSISNAINDFEAGKSLAYHEIADMIVECSNVFSYSLKNLEIADFNPDKLL